MADVPSCLFLNVCYPAFVADLYRRDPRLAGRSATEQQAAIEATGFGDADFYSHHLQAQGWAAANVLVNAAPVLAAWTRENGGAAAGLDPVVAQVRAARPDVLYLQDLSLASDGFVAAVRPYVRLIAGQIASPLPAVNLRHFDVLFSSFPHFVARFRAAGIAAHYQPLAFDARVLARLAPAPRDIALSFVGGISPAHGRGLPFLEHLARHTPIEFWGYGAQTLAPESPIRARHRGEAWGQDMFGLLARSRITVNRHIDVAENHANNMRLFEATGCGALLVTDYRDNLAELFEIGREVVAYRSAEECAELVGHYRAHPDQAAAIAGAGQARTLREHSYAANMAETAAILRQHLRRLDAAPAPAPVGVSTGYRPLPDGAVDPALVDAWRSPEIPPRQWALVSSQLAAMYRGDPTLEFTVLRQALAPFVRRGQSLLEVGCSSGYYSEVLQYLLARRLAYTGVDYSAAMIEMARERYPQAGFEVADGAALPFADASFDTVVSGCVLLHTPDWEAQLAEAARVTRDLIVLHRTPVSRLAPTRRFSKFAYGVATVELRFNENELVAKMLRHGAVLAAALAYRSDPAADAFEVSYVFRRQR